MAAPQSVKQNKTQAKTIWFGIHKQRTFQIKLKLVQICENNPLYTVNKHKKIYILDFLYKNITNLGYNIANKLSIDKNEMDTSKEQNSLSLNSSLIKGVLSEVSMLANK